MRKPGVLVTCRVPSAVAARLDEACEVDLYTGEEPMSRGELRQRLEGKQALMCLLTDRIDSDVMDASPALRVVANIAVGYDNVDVSAASARGIVVTNTPGVLTEATADFTWALILAVTRRIAEGERLMRQGRWKGWALDFMLGSELGGKQLGIVGLGRIGRAVATRAVAFGMRVAYADPGLTGHDSHGLPYARLPLDELLTGSDIISLHVPLAPETRHLINRRTLLRLKRSAYIVNTSRGAVIDEEALAWALREGIIAGAALDVYEHEPAIHADLIGLENIVLAPHLGSATVETRTAMADLAARNIIAVLSGEPPLTRVPESR
ncbi:MAG: D-glycerate dehydrogenase [Acidobacteriota bacterium]